MSLRQSAEVKSGDRAGARRAGAGNASLPRRRGRRFAWHSLLAAGGLALSLPTSGAASPHRGLWVGQVTLTYVNEVPVPLDENNVPVAPDPNVPTPTSDQAHLRLILHVNGAGQVSLLKDCAVLARNFNSAVPGRGAPVNAQQDPTLLEYVSPSLRDESDLALITDPRLYGEFPPQPAVRLASAVFDFGEGQATRAVNAVIDAVVDAVANSLTNVSRSSLLTATGQSAARQHAFTNALASANPVIANADVAEAFFNFRQAHLSPAQVTAIAETDPPSAGAAAALAAATALKGASFFGDTRGLDMVAAIVAAAEAEPDPARKAAAAQAAAAAFADLTNEYHRFISGGVFSAMISGAADATATAATAPGANADGVRAAGQGNAAVVAARSRALELDANNPYNATRAMEAFNTVLEAVLAEAVAQLGVDPRTHASVKTAAEAAGRAALTDAVARHSVATGGPTPDYNQFIESDAFQGSAEAAARAAAEAAVLERASNALADRAALARVARDAAIDALRSVGSNALGAAALTTRTELPLSGVFGPGEGDTRFAHDIKKNGLPALGPQALEGTILLPADHPTNPFRHRRHQEHSTGIDITRRVLLSFDGSPGDPLDPAGFGVDRITGTYREEIFGLHKPLGPDRDTGLRVEGRFHLNRVSLIDTLNAR